ncbi:MAG: tRNA lysidine(34) synthetase TilS [Christensenellaceae bacterium]
MVSINMEKSVGTFIKENQLIREGQNIGVAVSGGADSMALLICLCRLSEVYQFRVSCVHFEHGIRGQDSLDDADFVGRYCETHNIPFYMSAADVPELAQEWCVGKQEAAKRAREAYFEQLVQNGEVDLIATAHHMDDNAESVLMHILRGSGLDGLVGIHAKYGVYIRPFLCVTREQIIEYLDGQEYVTDQSNDDVKYTRNYIRNVVMPLIKEKVNPDAAAALNRLSVIAEYDAQCLNELAKKEYDQCAKINSDSVQIDVEHFNRMPNAFAYRIIKFAAASLHITQDIESTHIAAMLRLAKNNNTGTRVNISQNLCAEIEYGTLIISFSARNIDYSFSRAFDFFDQNVLPNGDVMTCEQSDTCRIDKTDRFCECLDADKVPAYLTVRTRQVGDVIRPLGAAGKKKLKDYFIDKKMPRQEREKTPLLADGSRIIWVVGHTIDEDYRVDENTKRFLIVQYKCKTQEEV